MNKRQLKLPHIHIDFVANYLNTRSPREKLFVIAFAIVFVLFLDFFFWLAPVVRALTGTMPTLSSLREGLDELKEDRKNEAKIREKWESTRQELADNEKGFEVSEQLPTLLENLSKLATESGVRITSLKPVEAPPLPGKRLYFSVPIEIKATAATHELGNFVSKLETAVTFFKITDLKISANTADERKHSIEMMVETYRKA